MLGLLMEAETALASLEGPPPYEIGNRQRLQVEARRAVRSEVAARARLATLGLHHPLAAGALLQLGLQLEEELGEVEAAARAIRRAYVGFRGALGRAHPSTLDALLELRRIENRQLSGLEHVHDDDLTPLIEEVEAPSDDEDPAPETAQQAVETEAEGDAGDAGAAEAGLSGLMGVSTVMRRRLLGVAVRGRHERALKNAARGA